MKCPYCGGNPVIYDPELNAIVCTHCGAVLEDRPIPYTTPLRGEDYYGSYIKSRRHRLLVYRHLNTVYGSGRRLTLRISRVVKSQCSVLGVSPGVCNTVRERVLGAVERITREHDVRVVHSELLQYVSAACMYAALSEQGLPVRLSDLSCRLSLNVDKLYSFLVRYGSVVGYKYTNKTRAYAPRVAQALSKQLGVGDAGRVMERALELMDKYSYLSTDPLKSAIAFTVLAAREIGVEISVAALCRELGIGDNEMSSMYARIGRIARRIKCLKNN